MTAEIAAPFEAYRGDEPYAFSSYAHADADYVYPILSRLHTRGCRLWYDAGIQPGTDWPNSIGRALEDCCGFIVFISPVSAARRGVANEVRLAHERNKPILVIELEPTELPSGLALLLGDGHRLIAHEMTMQQVIALAAAWCESLSIIGEPQEIALSAPEPTRPHLALPPEPTNRSVAAPFVNRTGQSQVMLECFDFQLARLNGSVPIEQDVFPNVLTFYGVGGVGKTALSVELQNWVSGASTQLRAEWGNWAHPPAPTVRWDLHDFDGRLSFVDLLVAVRAALIGSPQRWTAFDVALVAFLEAVRMPDGEVASGRVREDLLRSLKAVAAQLELSVPAELSGSAVRRVLNALLEDSSESVYAKLPWLNCHPGLLSFVEACSLALGSAIGANEACQVVRVLTEQIHQLPIESRPAIVVFVDAFERVQQSPSPAAECAVASLVAHLPYSLFVVTGRDRLTWYEPNRTYLAHAGPSYWPSLVPTATTELKQHRLGVLSEVDTRHLFTKSRDSNRWQMPDNLIEDLTIKSAGLPLHIEAVLQLARNLAREDPNHKFASADLSGELPHLVRTLLGTLPPAEADAFRAMCVLPSFDTTLVQAVGQVSAGAVERARSMMLVDPSNSELYPYQVHDEIRRLVRLDRQTDGYWAPADWEEAARRGMKHALQRIERDRDVSDRVHLDAIALAVRLGLEWDLYVDGLTQIVQDGPSVAALATSVPLPEADNKSNIADLCRAIQAIALTSSAGARSLEGIRPSHPEIDSFVRLWRVWRLRAARRTEEALAEMQMLVRDYPERSYYHHQYAVTLRMVRRFQDALDYEEERCPERLAGFRRVIDRMHGNISSRTDDEIRRAVSALASARYRHEFTVSELVARARVGAVDPAEVKRLLERSIAFRARGDVGRCELLVGYQLVKREAEFEHLIAQMSRKRSLGGVARSMWCQLLALRALHTRNPEDAERAYLASSVANNRGGQWIPTEVWLESLGLPLEPVETQWIIPYEQVATNWLKVADGILSRALP